MEERVKISGKYPKFEEILGFYLFFFFFFLHLQIFIANTFGLQFYLTCQRILSKEKLKYWKQTTNLKKLHFYQIFFCIRGLLWRVC